MEYEIYDRYQDLGSPEERAEWLDEYEGAINRGRSHEEAEVLASNCAQRAGYNVNNTGGLSIREIADMNKSPEKQRADAALAVSQNLE